LVLIAAGAILRWAVTADAEGVNLETIGLILLIVGAVGLALSIVFWSSWGGRGVRRRVVESPTGAREERVLYDDRV
jgi:hypothetical protein